MTRHSTLTGSLRRHPWITLRALATRDGFTHLVIHNGPLWRLCAGCRELRRPDRQEGQ